MLDLLLLGLHKDPRNIYLWGDNTYGQMGDSNQLSIYNYNWRSITIGPSHTAAIGSDGTLWSWGYNSAGQLGDGTTVSKSSPVQIGTATDWLTVATGASHTVATRSDGTMWTWGYNINGQLGDGTSVNKSTPTQVGLRDYKNSWSIVSCGISHTIGLKSDGSIWAWGGNNAGQLGQGNTTHRSSPVQIGSSSWTMISVASNGEYVAGILLGGSLFAWGNNTNGQLGTGDTTNYSSPVVVSASSWSFVTAGQRNIVGIKSNKLWTVGLNTSGQIGDGTTTDRSALVQIGNKNWTKAAAGNTYILAIDNIGALYVWGDNSSGSLGLGDTINRSQPTQLPTQGLSVLVVSAGGLCSAYINSDYLLKTFGSNQYGQLGDNS